jgi:hypothetical protein
MTHSSRPPDQTVLGGSVSNLDASVLLGSERFVELRSFLKGGTMGDYERGIDFALLDAPE